MERDLLRSLKYDLGTPTINTFLRRFLKDGHEDSKVVYLFIFLILFYFGFAFGRDHDMPCSSNFRFFFFVNFPEFKFGTGILGILPS